MHKLSAILSVSLITMMLLSCSNKPGYLIPQKKMVDVLYDIQLAQAIYNDYNRKIDTNEKKDALIRDVLNKHNVKQTDMDSSMMWYSDNIKLYMEINDSVANRLKKTREVFNNQMRARNSISSYDVLPPYFYMDNATPVLAFRIDSVKLKNMNPSMFSWRFDIMGVIPQDTLWAATLYTYNDTVVEDIMPIGNGGHYVFNKPSLPDSLLKDISGYVRMKKTSLANVVIYNINYIDSTLVPVVDTTLQAKTVADLKADQPAAESVKLGNTRIIKSDSEPVPVLTKE